MSWQVKSSLKNLKFLIILADFRAHETYFQHMDKLNSILPQSGCSYESYETTSFDEIVQLLIMTKMEKSHFFDKNQILTTNGWHE